MRTCTLFMLLFFAFSCGKSNQSDLKNLDLLKYGLPISILAPDSSDVKVMDLIVQKDITVKKGDDFSIQIFATDSNIKTVEKLKGPKMSEVKARPNFSKIISEENDGFIFEKKVNATRMAYDFRHYKIKGDKEYSFQTGLIGFFTLDQVERMYEAVKSGER